jgi:hypothetical protein
MRFTSDTRFSSAAESNPSRMPCGIDRRRERRSFRVHTKRNSRATCIAACHSSCDKPRGLLLPNSFIAARMSMVAWSSVATSTTTFSELPSWSPAGSRRISPRSRGSRYMQGAATTAMKPQFLKSLRNGGGGENGFYVGEPPPLEKPWHSERAQPGTRVEGEQLSLPICGPAGCVHLDNVRGAQGPQLRRKQAPPNVQMGEGLERQVQQSKEGVAPQKADRQAQPEDTCQAVPALALEYESAEALHRRRLPPPVPFAQAPARGAPPAHLAPHVQRCTRKEKRSKLGRSRSSTLRRPPRSHPRRAMVQRGQSPECAPSRRQPRARQRLQAT